MYRWGFIAADAEAAELLDTLPIEALPALQELMAAVELDPWGVAGKDPERDTNMPTVRFGPHAEGQVTYLILDGPRRVWITSVQWAG